MLHKKDSKIGAILCQLRIYNASKILERNTPMVNSRIGPILAIFFMQHWG